MTDYFDRVEHELRSAARRRLVTTPQRRRRRLRWGDVLAATCVVIALVIAGVALTLPHHPTSGASAGRGLANSAPTANPSTHPWLYALQEHLAVLRGPAPEPTAAERNLMQTYQTSYVRLAGTVAGTRIYFVVIPIRKHGVIASYAMNVISSDGSSYVRGNYDIFPAAIQDRTGRAKALFSIVPDGVTAVRWHFVCPHGHSGVDCRATPAHTYNVPVHGNLAALSRSTVAFAMPGVYYPTPTRVTWYFSDGKRSVFTSQNSAVPFPGAPRWPSKTHHH
jgi:hypothetical protein